MRIYIAPLQGYYSEILPTQPWLKRTVTRLQWNMSEGTVGRRHRYSGNLFQTAEPATRFCPVGIHPWGDKKFALKRGVERPVALDILGEQESSVR